MNKVYVAPRKTAGLNNLKMVMVGMSEVARRENEAFYFPQQVFDFTPTDDSIGSEYIPIEDVFSVESLVEHFKPALHANGQLVGLGNADYLSAAQSSIDQDVGQANIARNATARAFSAFIAAEPLQREIDRIAAALPDGTCALQLRIERDWQEYAVRKGWVDGDTSSGSEIVTNHLRIFDKISATDAISRTIFVCCDEDDLLISKDEITKDAEERGLTLIFKSSFNTPFQSRLQKCVIDFGVCLKLNNYIGTARSTFSNILCMVKAAEIDDNPYHYVFDAKSEKVERRTDCGRTITAARATSFEFQG